MIVQALFCYSLGCAILPITESIPSFALRAEHSHVEVDATASDETPYLLLQTFILLHSIRLRPVRTFPGCILLEHARRPSQTADEVIRCLDSPYTLPFLTQVPAPDRLIVGARKEILPSRMEDEGSYPVVMTSQGLDAYAVRAEDLDLLVSAAGREILGAAARWWRFLQSCEACEMAVCCWWSERAAFYYVFVGEECLFQAVALGL